MRGSKLRKCRLNSVYQANGKDGFKKSFPGRNSIIGRKITPRGLWLDRPFRRSIHPLNNFVTLAFPISDTAKLTRLVTSLGKFVSGTRRAPSTLSVKDELDIFGDVLHPHIQLGHRNVDGTGNGTLLFQFPVLTDID